MVNFGMSVRRGDVVSTALETPVGWAAANAISPDFVFGEERYAYRLSGGVTRSASLADTSLSVSAMPDAMPYS